MPSLGAKINFIYVVYIVFAMGVDLGKICEFKEIEISGLAGRKIAIDAFNTIYQFLSIIRQRDGTPLMDHRGNVTSHLSGLFYRNARLLEAGAQPAFVFDGKPPQLKSRTISKRSAIKKEAKEKYEKAKAAGDIKGARKYAQATSKIEPGMLDESKELLTAMGIPWVQAPSEGEAQAAYICQEKDVWAVGSQDFDSLLFGAPRLVRNITITGKRKLPGRNFYVDVKPESIELGPFLKELDITLEQLIDIGILVGTDFNPGIKGIGPKKALKLVTEKGIDKAIDEGEIKFEIEPELIREIFLKPEITKDYKLSWKSFDEEKILELLHEKHDFSRERISNALEKLEKATHAKDQQSLDKWV